MTWIATEAPPRLLQRAPQEGRHRMPQHAWQPCAGCRATVFAEEMERALQVCPRCGHHGVISARARLASLFDAGSGCDIGRGLAARDALGFSDQQPYAQRLARARAAAGEEDALVAQQGTLGARPLVAACFEYAFMGGSMGSVVGERFALAVDAACEQRCPFVCITASGGARMQEGLFSLLQMSKTVAAVGLLREARLPFVSILTNPTMGGVSASFAFLADVVVAEPGALIGFAGPRVIEQTVRQTLPPGFQRAEFLHAKGAVDRVADRREHAALLRRVFTLLRP